MIIKNDLAAAMRKLRVIHGSLLAGPVLFLSIMFYIVYFMEPASLNYIDRKTGELLLIVFGIMAVSEFFIARIFITRRLESIGEHQPLIQKLVRLESILIIIWALIEGLILFSVIIMFISRITWIAAISGMFIIVLIYFRPSANRIGSLLQLSQRELDQLYREKY
jgi:hypothetical protein